MNPAVYRGIEVPAYKGESAKLSSIIWKPLEPYLDSVKVIYYSPAGLLHRINFDAISLDKEARLGDNYKMLRLNNTRSLGESDSESSFESNDAILFGGIDYELDTAAVDSSLTINDAVFRSDVLRGLIWAGQDDAEKWNILSGTAIEINQIASILLSNNFQTVKYSEKDATEESFKKFGKQGNSPRILHIATHGFFFSNPLYVTSPKLDEMVADRRTVFKISDNPMIRSGLILYGANYAWKKNRTYKPGIEDGILTAYEISQTNLSNTELVVLSACETGLGDIQGNEGVYGLQRAFKIAGVKYLIMSLWQVPDKATSDFMTQFYMNWLEKKMTIPDAFRLTQKEMCQRFVDPYSWAGFVLIK
jgi:CHAT domain-containing protein